MVGLAGNIWEMKVCSMVGWKKKFGVLILASLMAVSLMGCGKGGSAKSDEIRIGALFELTGAVANYGKSSLNGAQMAVDEINGKGGLNGKKIRLVSADNKSEPSEAGNQATKLITKDKVAVIVGPCTSGSTAAASPVVSGSKVPLISPSATAPGITVDDKGKVRPYIFRVCFTDPFQGKILATFAVDELKLKKIAIYNDSSSDYSKGLAEVFAKTLESKGGEVVAQEAFLAKDQDFKATLTKLKAANSEALYVPAYYEEVSKIVKQAREVGITCPILGSDGWDSPKLVEIAGADALNGTYYSSFYSSQDTDPHVQQFIKDYRKKYNAEPDGFAINGYNCILVAAEAIKQAGSTDGTKIAKALEGLKDFQMATGKMTVDPEHNPIVSCVIIRMKDGQPLFYKKISA